MKRFFVIIMILFSILSLTACGNIKLKKSAEEYVGSNYEETIEELKQLGFSNIETVEIDDLTSSGEMADGTVSEVSINENADFAAKTSFPKDTKVVITYHIIKKLSSPIAADQISGMDYNEIAEAFTVEGFTNVQKEEIYDLDPDETNEEHRNEVIINAVTLSETTDIFPFDAVVEVICHYPYEKYDIQLKVDFVGNLLFNKYDVDLIIDGNKEDTLKHGKDWEGALRLKEGEHTITFSDPEDSSINGEVVLDVTSKTECEYKIFCHGNEITVDTVYINREIELADNEVKVLSTESDYKGKNYKDIKSELIELGFTNISTVPIYDIIWGITEEESVSDVSINGTHDFKRGDIFLNDVEVIITYHMLYDDDPERESTEVKNEDTGDDLNQSEPSTTTQKESHYDIDAEILDEYDAWIAVEDYGKMMYSKFKLHYMAGKLYAKQVDDNTWNLKAYCDVDDGNGIRENCNCEATVEGTNLAPVVTYFIVY